MLEKHELEENLRLRAPEPILRKPDIRDVIEDIDALLDALDGRLPTPTSDRIIGLAAVGLRMKLNRLRAAIEG